MPDRKVGKYKVTDMLPSGRNNGSPSAGETATPDVSDEGLPPRNKRLKKHHCTQQVLEEPIMMSESTATSNLHESRSRVISTIMGCSPRDNYNLPSAVKTQLRGHEIYTNTSSQTGTEVAETIQKARIAIEKQQKALKKAREAEAKRKEAGMMATTEAGIERIFVTHMQKGHMEESEQNIMSPEERQAIVIEHKIRAWVQRGSSEEVSLNEQLQTHTCTVSVGAPADCINKGKVQEEEYSTVPAKNSKEFEPQKEVAKEARSRDPAVRDASSQEADIALPPRCVSPERTDNISICSEPNSVENPVMSEANGSASSDQDGAQIPKGTLYKFPGPGEKHWCNLTLEERIVKIDLNPLGSSHGKRKRFIWAKVEDGPVYASIVDLSSSSDILDVLLHWLQSCALCPVPATDLGTTLIAHTWKLVEFVLKDNEDRLDEIRTKYKYTRRIAPRIQIWEKVRLKHEKVFQEIESLWGKGWKEECATEADTAGIRNLRWKHSLVKKVKKLAGASMERAIGRGEAWGLVLKEASAKGERAAVVGEDVWVVTESLIQRSQPLAVNCGCPVSLREILPNLPTPRSCSAIMPRRDAVALLKQIHARLPQPKQDFASLCHSHLRRLASGTFGLLNNTTPHRTLAERLCWVFDDLDEDGKNLHYEMNPQWFRKPFRAKASTDSTESVTPSAGLYKYPVQNPNSVIHAFSNSPTTTGFSTFTLDREAIFARYSAPGKFEEYLKYGTVRIQNLFSHLDPAIIDSEFDMYEHHFQPPLGTKPMGWLRIMYHSLTQQAIRQDPAVYALHAAAREDGCWRFISYPYYTKSTSPDGEKTGFFHFDINVSEFLANGKSRYVVQSAVTLVNDETPQGCTMLVPGFHKHIEEWWERHPDARRGGETTNIIPGKTYTKKDEWDYGPFIPYPCKAGELRITRPDIPHGSTPVSKTKRKVVFPWLIGIRDDHETLDVDTTETWSELAECHRNMVACKKSTSGRTASAYGRPEGKFMGAVVLGSTSCVGDALVGRRRWDDPEVVSERDLLLGDEGVKANKWVEEVRQRIKAEFERCWELVKELERKEFGENAFFREAGRKPYD